jgi:hypothetical protein
MARVKEAIAEAGIAKEDVTPEILAAFTE